MQKIPTSLIPILLLTSVLKKSPATQQFPEKESCWSFQRSYCFTQKFSKCPLKNESCRETCISVIILSNCDTVSFFKIPTLLHSAKKSLNISSSEIIFGNVININFCRKVPSILIRCRTRTAICTRLNGFVTRANPSHIFYSILIRPNKMNPIFGHFNRTTQISQSNFEF